MSHAKQTKADALAAMLRESAPPPIGEQARRSQIERAMAAARARPLPAPPARAPRLAWAIALAACALVVASWLAPGAVQAPSDLTLATGDRIHVEPGASLGLDHVDAHERRFFLREGAGSFDVAPLEGGRFEVRTPELTVVVRGTVFGVERHDGRTWVRVYEGTVEVHDHDRVVRVERGATYDSTRGLSHGTEDDPLAEVSQAAARARDARQAAAPTTTTASAVLAPAVPTTTELTHEEEVVSAPETTTTTTIPSATGPETAPAPSGERDRVAALPTADVEASELERWMASGRFEDARARAHELSTRYAGADGRRFAALEARALQGLGRDDEAATLFDTLARRSPASERPELAYRAAVLRLDRLGDAHGAIRSLAGASFDASSADGAALEERALGLRARALDASGDRAGAAEAAARYLERFPSGGLAARMHQLATP